MHYATVVINEETYIMYENTTVTGCSSLLIGQNFFFLANQKQAVQMLLELVQ